MATKGVVFAVCILALATVVYCDPARHFKVEGQVYCDPCRVQFQTKISKPIEGLSLSLYIYIIFRVYKYNKLIIIIVLDWIAGATVRLECRNSESEKNVTYSVEGVTDSAGHYCVLVEGEHEDDICEVMATKSPLNDCNIPFESADQKARISCTENNGVSGDVRLVNPLGFMTKHPDPQCADVLQELDLFSD